MDDNLIKAVIFVVLIVSLTAHEAAHALAAMLGGDRTAYNNGQVSLNPIPHIREEPFGMLILPLVMLWQAGMCLGFAKTPIDPVWARLHPARAAAMSAAGPIANFLLCGLAMLGLNLLVMFDLASPYADFSLCWITPRDGDSSVRAAGTILSVMALLNALLGLFNLIPWPPLDGAGVVRGLLPKLTGGFYDKIQSNGLLTLLGMGGVLYGLYEFDIAGRLSRLLYGWI